MGWYRSSQSCFHSRSALTIKGTNSIISWNRITKIHIHQSTSSRRTCSTTTNIWSRSLINIKSKCSSHQSKSIDTMAHFRSINDRSTMYGLHIKSQLLDGGRVSADLSYNRCWERSCCISSSCSSQIHDSQPIPSHMCRNRRRIRPHLARNWL